MSVAIGSTPQGTRVPPSLNKYPVTAVPLFLALTKRETYEIEKWRKIKNSEVNGKTFILPAPKSGTAHILLTWTRQPFGKPVVLVTRREWYLATLFTWVSETFLEQ